MNHWLDTLRRAGASGEPAVAVIVAASHGSTPRVAGARMLVTRGAVHDTIGGGQLEKKAIGIARDLLDGPRSGRALQRFALGASLGQCCGGAVTLLFDPLPGTPGAALDPSGADWVPTLLRWRAQGVAAMVVTPARGPGNRRLLVTADEERGSLPEPAARTEAVAVARALLAGAGGAAPRPVAGLRTLAALPDVPLLFEPVLQPALRIVLFGAGHVGRALVQVLAPIDCEVDWIDQRPGEFPAQCPPQVRIVADEDPVRCVDDAPPGACFLVMTHSHALDLDLAERILRRDDHRYFGLIGSATKRRSFEHRLAQRGVAGRALQRMTCPIGVRGIDRKEPAAIAIAVAAELLALPPRGAAASTRDAAWPAAPRRSA